MQRLENCGVSEHKIIESQLITDGCYGAEINRSYYNSKLQFEQLCFGENWQGGSMKSVIKRSKELLKIGIFGSIPKVFCISIQRTGTTSVGKFFRDFGFRWSGWPDAESHDWMRLWYEGNYEASFSSVEFRTSTAFEDSPWWFPGFYKILYHRFPNSKFVLFKRDPDRWFESMIAHSGGDILGDSRSHCKVYRREFEYYKLRELGNFDEELENKIYGEKTMKLIGHERHYKEIYQLHNTEVVEFFSKVSPESLHVGSLEDPEKWKNLGKYLGVDVELGYEARENVSNA